MRTKICGFYPPRYFSNGLLRKGADGMAAEVQTSGAVCELLARLSDPALAPGERAAVARALAAAGDPRPGAGVGPDGLPAIAWVSVPAGRYPFQEQEWALLPAFEIARYPVTVAQYQAFIDAPDGFRCRRWWHGLPLCEYRPEQPPGEVPNQPAERVSWCAAVAFTRWLSARTGTSIRLPTEQEWEAAARGLRGWRYPWGETYGSGCANVNETRARIGPHNLGRVVAVGLYPAGASCYGVEDLIGNVWEWCLNTFQDPACTEPVSDAARVLRGGAWCSGPEVCALTRDLDLPDFGYDAVGFRVVRGLPRQPAAVVLA